MMPAAASQTTSKDDALCRLLDHGRGAATARRGKMRGVPTTLRLKLAAMAVILVAGMVGVAIPLAAGRKRRRLRSTKSGFFALAKAFAAGVILATSFFHMLHDAEVALTDPCLPRFPWRRFPFSGFVAMAAAVTTLALDFLATQFYKRGRGRRGALHHHGGVGATRGRGQG